MVRVGGIPWRGLLWVMLRSVTRMEVHMCEGDSVWEGLRRSCVSVLMCCRCSCGVLHDEMC